MRACRPRLIRRSARKNAPIMLITLLVLTAYACVSPAAASAPSFVVQSDLKIGSFAVKANGTLAGAISAFGEPNSRRPVFSEACTVTWRSYGLTILFNNFGGQNPCSPQYGYFSRAIMRGQRWRSAHGLRIGMSSSRVRRYYPHAIWRTGLRGYWPTGWWLITRTSPFGSGNTSYPGLLAEARKGRIVSLQVRFPAGGD